MKHDIEALNGLVARLEKATGVTPELWAHISCALLAPPGSKVGQSCFNGAWVVYEPITYSKQPFRCWEKEPRDLRRLRDACAWTDASLALVEMLLPGWMWNLGNDIHGGANAQVYQYEGLLRTRIPRGTSAPTPALALVRAVVGALITQAEQKDETR